MENASKALTMAGGVLIALLVISLLVLFFHNVRDLQGMEQSSEEQEQAVEFNKQYDVYARNVYGSELLSIANKIADYNKREAENKGYTKIELYVQIQNDMDTTFFKKGTYTSSALIEEIEKVENQVDEIGKKSISSSTNSKVSRKISQLASMRTADIEALGILAENYKTLLTQYNTYKTLLTEVKAKVFQYVSFDYDKNNGRITKMNYKL